MTDYKHEHQEQNSPTIKELLIRLDVQMNYVSEELKEIKKNFITKTEFAPLQRLVYGAAGLMLTLLLGALMSLIINK